MSEERSAFILAREKALGLEAGEYELSGRKLVALPEDSFNIDSTVAMGWMKKQAPKPKKDALVIVSDPIVLEKIRQMDVTIFEPIETGD